VTLASVRLSRATDLDLMPADMSLAHPEDARAAAHERRSGGEPHPEQDRRAA
jgi:hypothetical protein